jgi:DNA-binding CsgD family transcriptional regulator
MARRGESCRFEKLGEFLDATYDLDAEPQPWFERVMEAARAVWGRPGPAYGAVYDAGDVANFKFLAVHTVDLLGDGAQAIYEATSAFTPAFVARTLRRLPGGRIRAHGRPEMNGMHRTMARLGYPDAMAINGVDPVGMGVFIGMWWRNPATLPADEVHTLRRMAHHLSAAHRCRLRLRESQAGQRSLDPIVGAEAILDTKKRVLHATGPARERDAQAELATTAAARDRARVAREGAVEELRAWRPLTSARWTLIDKFERNGARYIVARENQTVVRGLAALTDRERQVVGHLAMGQTTKEIAYALGISDVTVRVHLRLAATKLGVRSRAEVLAHPDVRTAFTNGR